MDEASAAAKAQAVAEMLKAPRGNAFLQYCPHAWPFSQAWLSTWYESGGALADVRVFMLSRGQPGGPQRRECG